MIQSSVFTGKCAVYPSEVVKNWQAEFTWIHFKKEYLLSVAWQVKFYYTTEGVLKLPINDTVLNVGRIERKDD